MKNLIYIRNVVTLHLNQSKCNGCGMCINVCPHEVFELREKRAYILNRDYCMECGACARNCESKAISVRSGVGCAAGILNGILSKSEPSCGCSQAKSKCS